jgi:hypothetical protein
MKGEIRLAFSVADPAPLARVADQPEIQVDGRGRCHETSVAASDGQGGGDRGRGRP